MEIINRRLVDLTPEERHAHAHFELMLDRGRSVTVAAARIEEQFPGFDSAFYRWLRGEGVYPPGDAVGSKHRSEWHEETWQEAVNVLREHFTDLGFEVHENSGVRTVTIIERSTSKALGILDATGTHYDGQGRLVWS